MSTPNQSADRRTRADLQRFALDLWSPVRARTSPGGARVRLGDTGAHFDDVAAEFEGFARPLWGLVPLAAGGGEVDLAPVLAGLDAGTDPASSEYWGRVADRDQRQVEMAALGFGLALVPERLWDPLAPATRDRLATWLAGINEVESNDNNWLFFRVLVNLGLDRVGSALHDPAATTAALDRLEEFFLGDGWYEDGTVGRADHYIPWAFHFYGLLYARLAGDRDPARAERFRERAAAIATDMVHWYADDGAVLPYGRSLTYRFAAAAFWGALPFADLEAVPWDQARGLYTRHLEWWRGRDVDERGILPIGYAYGDLKMAENYNSPGSPYWAMKAFLPLAVDAAHPFWTSDPAPAPRQPVQTQPHAALVLCDDREGGHVFALAGGQNGDQFTHGPEKYNKSAYSTAFAFSVPVGGYGLEDQAADSVLALSDDGLRWRVPTAPEEARAVDGVVWSRRHPWPDVEVETWLWAELPWQVRVHRIRTGRALETAEGGWALDRTGDLRDRPQGRHEEGDGAAAATYPAGFSGLRDADGARVGAIVRAAPNSNLMAARTVIPTLRGHLEPGEHVLRTVVLGSVHGEPAAWKRPSAPTAPDLPAAGIPAVPTPEGELA